MVIDDTAKRAEDILNMTSADRYLKRFESKTLMNKIYFKIHERKP